MKGLAGGDLPQKAIGFSFEDKRLDLTLRA
jgi:hypothetical protein